MRSVDVDDELTVRADGTWDSAQSLTNEDVLRRIHGAVTGATERFAKQMERLDRARRYTCGAGYHPAEQSRAAAEEQGCEVTG